MATERKNIERMKEVMQQAIASHPNQEHYTFVLDDPAAVGMARQAAEEVAAALGVRIVVLLSQTRASKYPLA